ncbi:MAG: PKD domain-containing protein [Acidimicrobiia bacterium]
MSRRSTVLIALVTVVAMVVAFGVGDAIWRNQSRRSTRPAAITIPKRIQASFQSLTGIRTGAPTVISGAVVNASGAPVDATLELSDLPAGVVLAQARPSSDAPVNGAAWSCSGSTCRFVDANGQPQSVAPNSGAEVMLAFTTPVSTPSDASVTITPAGGKPQAVAFALPNGAAPIADTAIVADVIGPATLQTGTSAAAVARVANVSGAPTAAGSVVVTVTPPALAGLTAVPSGLGWSCAARTCTFGATLDALQETPPLNIELTAAADAPPSAGALAVNATATVNGQPLQANHSVPLSMAQPKSTSVSTRLALDQVTVAAPATLNATASITPTGRGTLTDPVRISLALPNGLSANWGAASATGPWSCSASAASCSSTGPLPAGAPSTITLPITVATGTNPGTVHLELSAVVTGSDAIRQPDSASASLVIVPPPAPELRSTMATAASASPVGARPGDALRFSAGQPRAVTVTVANHGSRPAPAGQTVQFTAIPNSTQVVASAGGNGWKCNVKSNAKVSTKSPLRCALSLSQPLASEATLQLPVTLAPAPPGSSTWQINAVLGKSKLAATANTYTVTVDDDSPQFQASLVQLDPLYNGGSGRVALQLQNVGHQTASGGVAVIQVPAAAEVVNVSAPSWNCINASLPGANSNITCSTTNPIAAGISGPGITLDLATKKPTTSLKIAAWASAVGQFNTKQTNGSVSATIPVAGSLVVDAGQDITVVTPQRAANGALQPAVVTLHGTADLASAKQLRWTQLCTTPNQPQCNGTVSQPVVWLNAPAGQTPTTQTAQFTAPSNVTAPLDLYFQLSGQVGSKAVTDQVTVHLVPASVSPSVLSAQSVSGSNGGSAAANGGAAPVPQTTVAPNSVQPPVTSSIGGSASAVSVPTRAPAQLVGAGTGVGSLQYQWKQTAGPTATVLGGSNNQSTLAFETPTLQPNQQSESLSFQLTVTDSRKQSATASASVNVAWGDNGLQVQLAGGKPNVVSSIGAPVAITSQVTSRGAPYQYAWSVNNLSMPSGTGTNQSTLAFTAGGQPANGTATLKVTDSFSRVTTVSVPVIISALPNGAPPQAFCNALEGLTAGTPATLTGNGVSVTIPIATVNNTGPVFACTSSVTATFSDATATLPGGVAVARASGQLTVAGVSLTGGTVTGPPNWGAGQLAFGTGGLLVPFVSTTEVGVPFGSVTAPGLPLVQPSGWTGSTTVTFSASPAPSAVLSAAATSGSGGGGLTLTGSSTDGATQLTLNAHGLVGVGSVDIPVSGSVATAGPTAPVQANVTGALTDPQALGGSVSVANAQLAWTPQSATGSVTLVVGSGPGPLTVQGNAVIIGANTQLTFVPGVSTWNASPNGPALALSGTGSVTGQQLVLSLSSSPAAPWAVAHDLTINGLQSTLRANCALNGAQACAPEFAVTGAVTSSTFSGAASLSGTLNQATQIVSLSGATGTIAVAPVSVTNSQLTVALSSVNAPVATAVGTATVLGTGYGATVGFASNETLVAIPIGTQTISSGWTIPAVTAFATDVATTYVPPSGALPGPVSAAIPAGQLTAVGVTQLPAAISRGVIPANVSNALASYQLTSGAPSQYTLAAPVPTPWYIAGSAGSAMALTMTSIGFQVTVTNGAPSVAVNGTGTLQTAGWNGGAASTQPLTFAGALAAAANGGALSGTFTSQNGSSWNNAFGVSGLNVSGLSIAVNPGANGADVALTGTTSLPAEFAAPLGIATNATPNILATLSQPNACASIDLASGGATGINIAGAGFLASTSATLVVAPTGCAPTSDAVYAPGLSLSLQGGLLGAVVLAVNPATFGVKDDVTAATLQVGGLSLSNAVVTFDTSSGSATITVAGNTTLDGTTIAVSGTVQPPTTAGAVGSLTLASAPLSTFVIGGATLTNVAFSATSPSIPSPGSSQVTVTGTYSLLGQPTDLTLSSPNVQGGTITQLSGTGPANTTYKVAGTDSLVGQFAFTYNSVQTPSLTVQTAGATFTTPTQSYANATATITSTTQMAMTVCANYMTEAGSCGVVNGTYTYGGDGAGTYNFTNASAIPATLSGYVNTPTVLTFARANTGATETTQQQSTLTLGLFDTNEAVTVSGPIGGSLTGSLDDVELRGLSGNAEFSVSLAPFAQTNSVWYNTNITMNASSGCNLWSSQPTLTGLAYRSGDNTFYTLTGPVTFAIDGFSLGSVIPGQSNQPLVLSNELDIAQQNQQPANGITLQFSFSTGPLLGVGTAGFDLAECSYSLGAFLQFDFGAGQLAQALSNAFQNAGGGLTINQGNLFSNGAPPASLALQRALLQEQQVAANLNRVAQDAQNQAQALADQANAARQTAANAATDANNAQQRLLAASQAYEQALQQLATARENQQQVNSQPLAVFADEVLDAQTAVNNAQAQVQATQARVPIENAASVAASQVSEQEAQTSQEADARATAAANNANAFQEQVNQAHHASILQVTLDYTHCTTCEEQDVASIDGELLFGVAYVVDLGLELGWTNGSLSTIGGTVGGGFEYQFQKSIGPIGVYANASITLNFGLSYEFGEGWQSFTATPSLTAILQIFVSFWGISYNVTLANLTGALQLGFVPSDTIAGYVTFSVPWASGNASFGPDSL